MTMDKIIVSVTTWKKRDEAFVKMIEHFQNQTMKPDKIILWLSYDEYQGIVPEHLNECLKKKWIDEIRFVPGNTYAHKRWEVFREHKNDYVILIDDDLYYPIDYISELYNNSKQQKCPCCYFSKTENFINMVRSTEKEAERCSIKNHLYSGLCCFPPNTFPIEILSAKNVSLRDKYCPHSDDAWMDVCTWKYNIPVYIINKWPQNSLKEYHIPDTQEVGTWNTYNSIKCGDTITFVKNIANSIKALDAQDIVKKIYPDFYKKKNNKKSIWKV